MRRLWLLALLMLAPSAHGGTLSAITAGEWVRVADVIDGDTFRTARGDKVRLLGINAPEIAHDRQPAQPLGEAARARLRELIGGRTVRLDFDADREDDYGRKLAQVHRRDGLWVNASLLREGLAHVYTFTPNLRWCRPLLAAERKARINGRGIWRTRRFRVLPAAEAGMAHVGQFRLVQGRAGQAGRWRFRLGDLRITVPRKQRAFFPGGLNVRAGDRITIRGVIRAGRNGQLYLALHSPCDLERR
ncbi:MAG: thermonuclease family protein [Mariprofundaceae bacterium]